MCEEYPFINQYNIIFKYDSFKYVIFRYDIIYLGDDNETILL